jgi:hypothetical protein
LNTRLRYALLFVIAAAPLIGVVSLVSCRQDRSTLRDIHSALLLFGCFEVSAMFLLTSLAIVLVPPVTADGHHVMPIGQALVGLAGGGVVGAALTFVALRPSRRDRRLERLLLHGVGAAVIVAAVVAWVRG